MKLSIIVQSGSLAGQKRELSNGALTIGREENCGLKFDLNADRLVSKRHAYFQKESDGFYIVDANSTNGTFVNGARVSKMKLKTGDVVMFGNNGPQVAISVEQAQNAPQPAFSAPVAAPPQNIPPQNIPPQPPTPQPNFPPQSNPAPQFQAQTSNFESENYSGENREQKSSLGDSFANKVLFNPETMPAKNRTKQYIAAAATVVVGVFLALIVILITLLELGPVVAIIATIAAFTPACIYILPLLWLDRYDPEPPLSLALAFAWGALVAVVFSFFINTIIGAIFGQTVGAVISAPVFEEATKGIAVVLLLLFWRREFDGIVDGIVYAGVIALGFATVENILYYGRNLAEGGIGGLAILFVIRGIMSPFAHVIFTSMTGIGCGIARETHNKLLKFTMPVVGYLGAVLLHAIWNGVASFGGFGAFIISYVVFQIPFFIAFVIFAIYMTRREHKILKETLTVEVAKGVLTNQHMEIATSAFNRLKWSFEGLSKGKFLPRRRFLRAVSKLGLAWWHVSRANAAKGETMSLQQLPVLEKEVLRWREQV